MSGRDWDRSSTDWNEVRVRRELAEVSEVLEALASSRKKISSRAVQKQLVKLLQISWVVAGE